MTDPVVQLRNVTHRYEGPPAITALADVDVRVDRGELLAVVGQSGSGKTTMLNLMGTLDRPTEGSVLIDGIEVGTLSDRKVSSLRALRLGFVFQNFNLREEALVVDNVADGLIYRGVGRRERIEESLAVLDLVGLEDRARSKPPQLSGGQRQRVAIARALAGRPSLILADEPTGNLDSATGAQILSLLIDLNARLGSTIVVITHDTSVAASLPRRISLLDGRVQP